jgi:peptide/nickel transport system substrate-binding protein
MDLDMISATEGWAVGYRTEDETGDAYGVMLRFVGRGGASQETPVATESATLTAMPASPTPPEPGLGSPTPSSVPPEASPTLPGTTPDPVEGGKLYLPMIVKNAEVTSTAGRRLAIAVSFEPDTLYLHGGFGSSQNHVFAAIYDAPFDTLGYAPQPSMLSALPRVGEGVRLSAVDVAPGERYVDAESREVMVAEELLKDLPQLEVEWTLGGTQRWEDGEPVTMADSVFSRTLECDPDTPTDKFLCERSADYRALDAITLRWTGLPGFIAFGYEYETAFAPPLPRHQRGAEGRRMDAMSAEEILEDEIFTRRPLANGPFRIARWIAGEALVLERNPWYEYESFSHDGERFGQPYLDHLTFRFVVGSAEALAALRAGAVDLVLPGVLGLQDIDALHEAQAEGRLEPYLFPGRIWEQLSFNLDPVDGGDGAPTPFGACRALRHAVSMAIDRATLVDVVNAGVGGGMYGIVPPEHWAAPGFGGPLPAHLRFDSEGAKAQLQALGFVDGDGDGIREAREDIECLISREDRDDTRHVIPAGTPLRLRYLTTQGNAVREELAALIRSWLKPIGIEVSVDFVPANILFSDGPDGPLFGRSGFELGQFAWNATNVPDLIAYLCSQVPSEENAWSGRNLTGWCDMEFEGASFYALNSVDRKAVRPHALQAQARFIEDLPAIPLYPRVQIAAARAGLIGPHPDPSSASLLWNIEKWHWGE